MAFAKAIFRLQKIAKDLLFYAENGVNYFIFVDQFFTKKS
jgi:hypothetical protein